MATKAPKKPAKKKTSRRKPRTQKPLLSQEPGEQPPTGKPPRKKKGKESPEAFAAIVASIENGVPFKYAARSAGVTYDTFRNWFKRGLEGEAPFDQFAADCQAAEARCINGYHTCLNNAVKRNNWKAAKWLLSKKLPDVYGDKITVDNQVSIADRAKRLENLTDEEFKQWKALSKKVAPGPGSE